MPPTKLPSVFLVGAGPGDPGLVTLRARELIEQADILLYDRLVNPLILDWTQADCEKIYVGKNPHKSSRTQEQISQTLVEKARTGRIVVRLKGGDPFIFGRGGEEAEALLEAGIHFEVVPGVTSAIAGPAYAGIPVTHREAGSMALFVTGHEDPTKGESHLDFKLMADPRLTVVFLMSLGRLEENMKALIAAGRPPSTPAAVVGRATYPQQRTVLATVTTIAERVRQEAMHAPAVTIVGEVAGLHATLAWYEARPLFGKRVVLTRERARCESLAHRLTLLGAEVITFPTIEIHPRLHGREAQSLIEAMGRDWDVIAFTSVNGVEAFFSILAGAGLDARSIGKVARIAAVGPKTATALEAKSLLSDIIPEGSDAIALADSLEAKGLLGGRILFPCAAGASDELPRRVREAGGEILAIPLYETRIPSRINESVLQEMQAGHYDALVFTSASTAEHFHAMTGRDFARETAPAVAIGRATAQALHRPGHPHILQSEGKSEDALVAALLKTFADTK